MTSPTAEREKKAAYQRRWREANPENLEKARANSRQWAASNRERAKETTRRHWVKRDYGLTVEEYEEMLSGGCAICGVHDIEDKGMHLDHDHQNGENRAALCRGCNQGLGCFSDDAERMRKAALYVEGWALIHG